MRQVFHGQQIVKTVMDDKLKADKVQVTVISEMDGKLLDINDICLRLGQLLMI